MKAQSAPESLIARIGTLAGWLNLPLIALMVLDVILRKLFSVTATWVIELEWHFFAVIFLLGIPYALQRDRHVRVDLFYEKFSPRERALVDLVGSLIFLIPWAAVLLYTGSHYALEAFSSGEGSPNPGGIPRFWPIKMMIPLMALLLLLQAVLEIVKAYKIWAGPPNRVRDLSGDGARVQNSRKEREV